MKKLSKKAVVKKTKEQQGPAVSWGVLCPDGIVYPARDAAEALRHLKPGERAFVRIFL